MPIFSEMLVSKIYLSVIKPVIDVAAALVLLVLLFPFLVIIGLIILLDLRRSPIFLQNRVGRNEKIFSLLKFRTMRVDEQEDSATKLGRLIRSFSIDEWLQLINIIKGDMSFIGPRPLLPEYIPYYNEEEKQRHLMKPGMTGWAQVNGRNEIDWGERMKKDIYYIGHASFFLDLKIVFMTFGVLLKRDPISAMNGVTTKFSDYASKR